ncbi:MAG: hypothetical protein EPO13_12400 [Actinomycetota bacterium]|nr:MAG: hypothetical protein EPO13_12400 [Actinomycetota bacterium]
MESAVPPLLLRDLLARNAEIYPNDRAVVCGTVTRTWTQLQERVFRLANRLRQAGVDRGDRIIAVQRNGAEIPEIYFAAALLGAMTVPISNWLTEAEASYIVSDSTPAFAFVEAGHAATAAFANVPTVATKSPAYEDFLAAGSADEPPEVETAGDPVFLMYTSGTTGRPKGVVTTQSAMIQNGWHILLSQDMTHDDVFLSSTPLTHAAAGTRVFSMALDGHAHVILERYTAEAFIEAVETHGVTVTILVPTMIKALLDSEAFDAARLSSMRVLIYGAAPTPLNLVERAAAMLPCGLLHSYGQTETGTALTVLTPDEHRRFLADPATKSRASSIGRVIAGVRMKIVDEDGVELPAGQAGELVVRSTKGMIGYWHLPEATASVLSAGWIRTGDVASKDDDGYYFLHDRQKDMFISGGLNVYPLEIERVLLGVPGILECAVVGGADDHWGEVPVAFIVGTPELLTAAQEACAAQLAGYKQPKRYEFVDSLPRNGTGKVMKPELRDRLRSMAALLPEDAS